MPKPGFYAVRVGRVKGVYETWDKCRLQIDGYPNARYKRFSVLKEAEDFISGNHSSAHVLPQESNSDGHSTSKGKKRAHAEIEDPSCWDVVYSDGACKGNGAAGSVAGIGVWWGHGDPRNISERCPGHQTNNRAELMAILRVLETTSLSKTPLLIKTDSQYSIDCFDKWIRNWKRNNWTTATGNAVKNDAVIRCIDLSLAIRSKIGQKVHLQHVKGHSGVVGNEGADFLANEGTLKAPVPDRDWYWLAWKLKEELDSVDPKIMSNGLMEVQGPMDATATISPELHTKSRKLGATEVPSHSQLDKASTGISKLMANPSSLSPTKSETPSSTAYHAVRPTETRSVEAQQDQSGGQLANVSLSSPEPKPLILLAATTRREKDDDQEAQASIQIPSGIPTNSPLVGNTKKPVLTALELDRTALPHSASQFLQGGSTPTVRRFHTDSPSQSPVKVLCVAPPLVPVSEADVNFEDYADCLLDGDDLVLELSDWK